MFPISSSSELVSDILFQKSAAKRDENDLHKPVQTSNSLSIIKIVKNKVLKNETFKKRLPMQEVFLEADFFVGGL